MIRVLPPEVVNQIAAGEVVERPFSVVKELVENSLDAGATRIVVEVVDGGREMIRVQDDGAGFEPDDLELAFVSHATSKLAALGDLDHIASLGFRGEALASIGSVGRATIRSRTRDRDAGHEIGCDGGAIGALRPWGGPPGTVIELRDLFFKTPARRRFLRTPRSERAKVEDLIARLGLARLDVDFTLLAEGRELLRLPAGESLAARIGRAFGDEVAGQLIDVEQRHGEYHASGAIASPDFPRRDASQALLYVNGRLTRDRQVTMAVRQAYREFLMHGRQPVHFLMLALPPDEVDVNVHPTKSEVRFLYPRRAAGLMHDAVAAALRVRMGAARRGPGAIAAGADRPRAQGGFPELPAGLFGEAAPRAPIGSGSRLVASPAGTSPPADGVAERATASPDPAGEPIAPPPAPRFAGFDARPYVTVLDCYLVFPSDDGLVVVDQHALHERVLYERFRRRDAERAQVAVQRLLVPEVIELAPADKAWLLDHAGVLAEEGFVLEDFGGRAIAVQGLPAILGRARPAALIDTFLRGDGDERPKVRDAIVERFHSMACRAAVMSGDRLREPEVRALLAEAATLEHPHHCPHGRPTTLTFSEIELER